MTCFVAVVLQSQLYVAMEVYRKSSRHVFGHICQVLKRNKLVVAQMCLVEPNDALRGQWMCLNISVCQPSGHGTASAKPSFLAFVVAAFLPTASESSDTLTVREESRYGSASGAGLVEVAP